MNDRELDEMLDQWKTPPMSDSLRATVQAGFDAAHHRPVRTGRLRRIFHAVSATRIRRLALATVGAAALVFAIIQLSPRTVRMASPPAFRIPFYVEFDLETYRGAGPPRHISMTSFPYAGHEITMSSGLLKHSFINRLHGIARSIRTQLVLAVPSLVLPKGTPMQKPAWFDGFVRGGCTERRNVVGRETVAGHETTVIQDGSPQNRITVWLAPDLDCFALKMTMEVREPDGTYRLESRKEAVAVTMNP
ncbi:MAG: hypothetical protein ABI759_17855 [Candidatus Solibacter sp.]